eukprot:645488-Pyramimonas_sp.AAC.1
MSVYTLCFYSPLYQLPLLSILYPILSTSAAPLCDLVFDFRILLARLYAIMWTTVARTRALGRAVDS